MPSPIIFRRQNRRRGGRNNNRSLALRLLVAGFTALVAIVGITIVGSAIAFVVAYSHFTNGLPGPGQIEEMALTTFETTKIYDRTGEHLLYEVQDPKGGERTFIPLQDIPMSMRQAAIALEDKTFYTNPGGINIEGIVRAFWNNMRGLPVQGGSSITAQLVRNVIMTPEERRSLSYERKIKEAILSFELTRRFPGVEGRDRLLELYLNTVYYGSRAYGVEAAAKTYFGKHAKDLTLTEAAMLASIPQSPSKNPIDNPGIMRDRQAVVLDAMVNQGYITPTQAQETRQAEVGKPVKQGRLQIEAPHFIMHLLKVMEERYGKQAVYGGGLRVITTLDYDLQKKVEDILRRTVRGWPASSNARNAASVVIRPTTGEVLAMVGSIDYFDKSIDGEVNMAVEPRQPGSSIKPFTYAAAFEQGYNPGSMIEDTTTTFIIGGSERYVPHNFDGSTHGKMPLRRALACSYNIPAVIMLNRIGIDSMLEMAHRLGITTLRDRDRIGLSVTLGGSEVRLIDHTYAFSVFANGGVMAGTPVPPQRREPGYREMDPALILRVTDVRGKVIDEYLEPVTRRIISSQVAYQVTSVLSDNAARTPSFGPVNALVCSRPAAAKTGTTNNSWDCWTMGYNPQLTVGVWVGNANRTSMGGWYGAIAAAPIWRDIMEYAFKTLPPVDFVQPPGMKWVEFDAESGASPGSGGKTRDILVDGWEPVSSSKKHFDIAICRASGQLATENCPPNEVEHRGYDLYPTANGNWVRSTKGPQPPTSHCTLHKPKLQKTGAPVASANLLQARAPGLPALGFACEALEPFCGIAFRVENVVSYLLQVSLPGIPEPARLTRNEIGQ